MLSIILGNKYTSLGIHRHSHNTFFTRRLPHNCETCPRTPEKENPQEKKYRMLMLGTSLVAWVPLLVLSLLSGCGKWTNNVILKCIQKGSGFYLTWPNDVDANTIVSMPLTFEHLVQSAQTLYFSSCKGEEPWLVPVGASCTSQHKGIEVSGGALDCATLNPA